MFAISSCASNFFRGVFSREVDDPHPISHLWLLCKRLNVLFLSCCPSNKRTLIHLILMIFSLAFSNHSLYRECQRNPGRFITLTFKLFLNHWRQRHTHSSCWEMKSRPIHNGFFKLLLNHWRQRHTHSSCWKFAHDVRTQFEWRCMVPKAINFSV